MKKRLLWGLAISWGLSNCAPGTPSTPPDIGGLDMAVAFDAAPSDVSSPDLGLGDSGIHPDAAVPDSGRHPDATIPDSGEHPDATIPDSGEHPDAMVADLGTGAGPITHYVVEEGGIPYTARELEPRGNPNYPRTNGYIHTEALRFELELFGSVYPVGTPISISSHGYVAFGAGAQGLPLQNQSLAALTSTAGVIAPLWQSVNTGNKGMDVFVGQYRIVVTWYNTYRGHPLMNSYYTLHIEAATGHVKFTYYNTDGHDAATIGIKGSNSMELSERACSPNCDPTPFYEIVYHPNGRPPPGPDVYIESVNARPGFNAAYPDEDVILDVTFRNRGGYRYQLTQEYVIVGAHPPGASIHEQYVRGKMRNFFGTPGHFIPPGGSVVHSWNLGTMRPVNFQMVIGLATGPTDWVRSNDISPRLPDVRSLPWIATCEVTNTPLPPATVGQPYSVQFTGSGCPNHRWRYSGLPSWASLDPLSGLLSGTPTAPAAVNVGVVLTSADRGYHQSSLRYFPLVVSP